MTAKKSDVSAIKNIGMGILDTLQAGQTKNEEPKNKSSRGKEAISNGEKEEKSKRSFMLTGKAVQKLNLLKLCMTDKDLSTLVEESINLYFEKNRKSIEDLIEVYEKIK